MTSNLWRLRLPRTVKQFFNYKLENSPSKPAGRPFCSLNCRTISYFRPVALGHWQVLHLTTCCLAYLDQMFFQGGWCFFRILFVFLQQHPLSRQIPTKLLQHWVQPLQISLKIIRSNIVNWPIISSRYISAKVGIVSLLLFSLALSYHPFAFFSIFGCGFPTLGLHFISEHKARLAEKFIRLRPSIQPFLPLQKAIRYRKCSRRSNRR